MGDRHGGRFARRGRALNPPRPQVDAHRGVGFRWRATVFRCRGVVGRICPRAGTRPSAKVSRHGARAKGFAPRRNTPLGESLPTRRTSKRICPAQERSPRRRPPDTAHERRDLPRARRLSSAKASRHGARAKKFAPRRNTPLGEGLPTQRKGERICPAQEHAPRRRPPDMAHEQKNLPRARRLSSAKASRHGARAKGFAPRGSRLSHVPTNGGSPSVDGQPKNTPSAGSHPQRGRPLPSSFTEKK